MARIETRGDSKYVGIGGAILAGEKDGLQTFMAVEEDGGVMGVVNDGKVKALTSTGVK